ncbi:IDEAL domain-containing protein [Bacillus xiapuensis]|uniref:IDEAL domain-containing protein n=1 Tax=Bacillus xiapuensis TaxID=2014075 RepID=A0ABU6NDY4_9BACI|nr:IDEAL domain-containing protein [Bacillus xiapuensis]
MALYAFKKGDWVKGTSRDGELVRGYVVSVNQLQDVMKVYVNNSDNEKIIGKETWLLMKTAEILPIVSPSSEDEFLFLIDLSLATRDYEWFMELTEKLQTKKELKEFFIQQPLRRK